MRRLLTAALLAATLSAGTAAEADSLDLTDLDKQAHVAVAYGLSLSGAVVLRRHDVPKWQATLTAASATLAIGLVKELVLDDELSWADQGANAIGVSLSTGVVFAFDL